MINRLRRLVARTRLAPARIDTLETAHRQTTDRVAALEQRVEQVVRRDVPGLVLAVETTMESRLVGMAASEAGRAERTAIAAARAHAEAAAAASQTAAYEAAREYAAAATDAVREASVLHAEQLADGIRIEMHAELAAMRRELAAMRRATASRPPAEDGDVPPGGADPVPATTGSSSIDPSFYAALEDRFRGDPELIAGRQRAYLPLMADIVDAAHPAVDLGCGRGEWLKLLAEAGLPAIGVDNNPSFVGEVAESGATMVEADLVTWLHAAPDHSAGAITMFQVVEHLPLPVLLDTLAECVRVLRPGGILVAETPNSLNLRVAATTFWLDPTHERPLHPELLKFIARQVGFARTDGWFLNELGDPTLRDDVDPQLARLLEMVDGPGDFTLLAWT